MLSCLYFAKDVDRWKRNQRERKWDQFCVSEVCKLHVCVIQRNPPFVSSRRRWLLQTPFFVSRIHCLVSKHLSPWLDSARNKEEERRIFTFYTPSDTA